MQHYKFITLNKKVKYTKTKKRHIFIFYEIIVYKLNFLNEMVKHMILYNKNASKIILWPKNQVKEYFYFYSLRLEIIHLISCSQTLQSRLSTLMVFAKTKMFFEVKKCVCMYMCI